VFNFPLKVKVIGVVFDQEKILAFEGWPYDVKEGKYANFSPTSIFSNRKSVKSSLFILDQFSKDEARILHVSDMTNEFYLSSLSLKLSPTVELCSLGNSIFLIDKEKWTIELTTNFKDK
jgi:hypothetical protein